MNKRRRLETTKPKARSWVVLFVLLLICLLVIPSVWADTVTIDTFNEGNEFLQVTTKEPPVLDGFSVYDNEGILGAERDIHLHWTEGTNYITLRVDNNNNNYIFYAADPGMKGWAEITWDGNDSNNNLTPDGLGHKILDDGINDLLMLSAVSLDHNTQLKIDAYTDANNWSTWAIDMVGGTGVTRLDVAFFFDDFVQGGTASGPVQWNDLGALVLKIDGTIQPDLDLSIDNIAANASREYGDLPLVAYGPTILGANHIPMGMRLGYNVDGDAQYNGSEVDATGDDKTDADDEDGVTPSNLPWTAGAYGGQVEVTFMGCSTALPCYLNGWIDWNGNGILGETVEGASEHIIVEQSRTGDITYPYFFRTPDNFTGEDHYYARFRVCQAAGACNSVTATSVRNGEVEDYLWYWGPTAVKLTSFTAAPAGGAVRVAWETASEHDNAGFHLYRSTSAEVQGERLNQYLIPSAMPGGDQGASYEFLDTAVGHGQTYYYLLEDVDLSGLRTPHGPIAITTPYMVFLPLVRR